MSTQFIKDLNVDQLSAVTIADKPLRVIAGAGSGKTKVITSKITYLISELGIPSWKILAVTFTNKATKEMKTRVQKMMPELKSQPFISTFHALCVRILREEFLEVNLEKNFLIIDTTDQKNIINKILKNINISSDSIRKYEKIAINKISDWKNNFMSPAEVQDQANSEFDFQMAKTYERYLAELKRLNSVDFDDLILLVHKLFKTNIVIQEKWRNRFDYVLVDEFQDTNEIQFDLIKWLTLGKDNLTVVGDPDQTIYSWRGAQVGIILNFEKNYKNAKTVILKENYRSTQNILNLASDFITHNKNREAKEVFSNKSSGEKIALKEAASKAFEAKFVVEKIKELVEKENYKYSDFYILYRINAWSLDFEKALNHSKIPFQMVGGLKFRDRKVIKDILALLKLATFGDDLAALRVLGFTPKVGAVTIEKLSNIAQENNLSIYELLTTREDLVNLVSKNLGDIIAALLEGQSLINQGIGVFEFTKKMLNLTGYWDRLKFLNKDDDSLQNLQAFLDQVEIFDKDFKVDEYGEENHVLAFLQNEALDNSEIDNFTANKVTLMTIHAAKGLENKVVFIVGLNNNVFPLRSAFNSISSLEEERRALYVAITRAEERLFLSYVVGERSYISDGELSPSLFIKELNQDLYDFEKNIFYHSDGVMSSNHFDNFNASLPTAQKIDSNYKKGVLVKHVIFGDGVVTKVLERQVMVAFDNPKIGVMSISINSTALQIIKH
ncbi:ATP-dependent DNA helicase [Spiroplasma sabaudiense Ar-1343]|uniref:DNA 3'-5' helicase n=1 Tax=Spiroplasma sabaudiense Ar-1343 TaxID=1276257 RepID=W6AIH2_9MOLU|nr:UvrD-helicase domain-containing protein [Spiroplasma sabaudiense]AHI53504.1 ATP-dependent DNA helicase [Spiroplasma sabaudiense Ar-1343]